MERMKITKRETIEKKGKHRGGETMGEHSCIVATVNLQYVMYTITITITIMMNGWEGCKVRLKSSLGFYCAADYLC